MAATKRDFAINYGLKTDFTGSSAGSTLFVDQSGDKVGIGTTTPQTTLSFSTGSVIGVDTTDGDDDGALNIAGGGGNSTDRGAVITLNGNEVTGSNGSMTISAGKGGGTDALAGAINFATGAGSTTRMLIKGDGNVGINDSNPSSQLAVNGYITESTDSGTTYWNVVTQQDVGTAANQVPLNQYLGQLAFLDDFSPNGLRRTGGASDDVSIDSNGIATFSGTGSLIIPSGTTTEQTPSTTGAIRFNTTISSFEGYNGSNWGKIGGGANVSATAPSAGIASGDLWYDSEGGRLYIYYTDADSSQWVDASPFGIPTTLEITNGFSVTGGDSYFANNVGIGTAAPTVPLTVSSSADHSDIAIFHAGGGTPNRGLKISTFSNTNANAGVEFDAQMSTGAFKFSTGGTERLRIDSSGRVKIGPIADHTAVQTHCPVYIDVHSDISAFNNAEGGANTGLVRIEETGDNANRYHGIELRNRQSGDIRFMNLDRNTSDRGDFVMAMPDADANTGLHYKMRFDSIASSLQIAGKGGATLGSDDTEHTDICIVTKTGVTAVTDGAGGKIAGLIRFTDKGANDNRYHGLEIRNRNSGDIRILNLDEGTTNKGNMVFAVDNGSNIVEAMRITSGSAVLPGADATQDLGSTTKRWANIYSADLQLSNEGSANDVDGTWGQYTIQEGEEDLFLINRRSGKKYKFNLTEI